MAEDIIVGPVLLLLWPWEATFSCLLHAFDSVDQPIRSVFTDNILVSKVRVDRTIVRCQYGTWYGMYYTIYYIGEVCTQEQ